MEATYVPDVTQVEKMVARMDELDIAQIVFAPANVPNAQPSLALYQRYPDYFVTSTSSGEFARWWNGTQAFLDLTREELASGRYFAMGEHEFRHLPSPEQVAAGNRSRDITIPIDGPAGHALFKLSEDAGVSFQIHYEIEDALLPPLEAMLAQYPRAQVIWCHLGMIRYPEKARSYGPGYVQSLIERFPGLHFDLAVPRPDNIYRPSGARDSTLYEQGRLAPAWRDLLERHPTRFLAASDYRPPVENIYAQAIDRQRTLILDALGTRAQHLIAYRNAWRLLTGQPWNTTDT